jgi:hypothetical protein
MWELTSLTQLSFSYSMRWVPPSPREHDQFIIDIFRGKKLNDKDLVILNRCRLHLQVISLLDIVTVDGQYFTTKAINGVQDTSRVSSLSWPQQGRPRASDWTIWREQLETILQYGHLPLPLGNWVTASHQSWHHHVDQCFGALYVHCEEGMLTYHPITGENRTRSGQ